VRVHQERQGEDGRLGQCSGFSPDLEPVSEWDRRDSTQAGAFAVRFLGWPCTTRSTAAPAIVFLHEGIADSRLWEPQWTSFAMRYRLLRCDLSGFGRTPIERLPVTHAQDVVSLLDELDISSAGIVGASLGGRVALELAVARPDLVYGSSCTRSCLRGCARAARSSGRELSSTPAMCRRKKGAPRPRGVQKLDRHAAASSYSWMRPPSRSRRLT
jgi:pimeloyl-ACP methyl ester carboxylesterase